MHQKNYLLSLLCSLSSILFCQTIEMNFPHFAGKTYDFIIFQGDQPMTISDTIPNNGKFTLTVPKQYEPYTGMSRWLITNTMEGGGIDMIINGKNFSIECNEILPDQNNIIYKGNTEISELNNLFLLQQNIIDRYTIMKQAVSVFPNNHKKHEIFQDELKIQINEFENFQKDLVNNKSYAAQFINIVNISQGISSKLEIPENLKAENVAYYLSNEMDWDAVYNSGYWGVIINAWVDIHLNIINDHDRMNHELKKISGKISNPKIKAEFTQKIVYYLNEKNKINLIEKFNLF